MLLCHWCALACAVIRLFPPACFLLAVHQKSYPSVCLFSLLWTVL
jgi:hypothetical protein